MLQPYNDILEIVDEHNLALVAHAPKTRVFVPQWWDENGVPRFATHHPYHCPDIYADEVVLVRISCQACGKEMNVQMSHGTTSATMQRLKAFALVERELGIKLDRPKVHTVITLANHIVDGTLHYGDPPYHGDACRIGPTMNCYNLRVVEFWENDSRMGWARRAELEIELPDAKEHPRG